MSHACEGLANTVMIIRKSDDVSRYRIKRSNLHCKVCKNTFLLPRNHLLDFLLNAKSLARCLDKNVEEDAVPSFSFLMSFGELDKL